MQERRTFCFVAGLPADGRERAKARTLVRTHAANSSRWVQMKQQQRHRTSESIAHHAATTTAATTITTTDSRSACDSETLATPMNAVSNRVVSSADSGAVVVVPGGGEALRPVSLSYLSQIPRQPDLSLNDHISVLPGSEAMKLLAQVYNLFQSEFALSKECTKREADKLMSYILADRGLLHCFLYSQQTRNQARTGQVTPLQRRQMFLCYAEAVAQTNARIWHANTACGDANIISVLVLACHGKVRALPRKTCTPVQGPLRSLEHIDLYGGPIFSVRMHEDALHRMVFMRGGLMNLPYAIARMISVADTTSSTRVLECPRQPHLEPYPDAIQRSLEAHYRDDHPLCKLGTGFEVLCRISSCTLTHYCCRLVLLRLALYSLSLDDYLAGRYCAETSKTLADHRNFVQHGLLTERTTLDKGKQSLQWLCMQAATIYSLTCIYPIADAPFAKLASSIKSVLIEADLSQAWLDAPQLMTWVITMSAIAALDTPEHQWYVVVLERCMRRVKIDTWQAYQNLLLDFLWFPSTNDKDGQNLWDEIENAVPFQNW